MRKWTKILLPVVLVPVLIFLRTRVYQTGLKMQCVTLLVSSLFLAAVLTPLFAGIAVKLGILDQPDERKVHTTPMPLLGGVAVALSLCLVILVNFHFSLQMKGIVIGGLLIFVTGLVDDIRPLSASFRLCIQMIACAILVKHGVMVSFLANTVPGKIGESAVTFIWILWVMNAVNFFDGLDGLASGLVAIASSCFLIVAIQTHQTYFAYLAAGLIGVCIAFLVYNFHPASVFLGDSGSGFLGFTLGALAVMGEWSARGPAIALSVPLLILGVFVFDMLYITIFRIARGDTKNLKQVLEFVGKDHFHHRLTSIGFTHRQAVAFIYLLGIAMGLGALVLRTSISPVNVIFLLTQAIIVFLTVSLLMRVKR
jgi:UDP-GlcNAc:undecaprenyl-phosphate GlcNAc-1-phosphate transferase